MRTSLPIVFVLLTAGAPMMARPASEDRPQKRAAKPTVPTFELTVDSIMRGPDLVGFAPTGLRWSGDSMKLYFEWRKPGEDEASTYVVAREGGAPRRLSDAERKKKHEKAREAEALPKLELPDGQTAVDRSASGRAAPVFAADRRWRAHPDHLEDRRAQPGRVARRVDDRGRLLVQQHAARAVPHEEPAWCRDGADHDDADRGVAGVRVGRSEGHHVRRAWCSAPSSSGRRIGSWRSTRSRTTVSPRQRAGQMSTGGF